MAFLATWGQWQLWWTSSRYGLTLALMSGLPGKSPIIHILSVQPEAKPVFARLRSVCPRPAGSFGGLQQQRLGGCGFNRQTERWVSQSPLLPSCPEPGELTDCRYAAVTTANNPRNEFLRCYFYKLGDGLSSPTAFFIYCCSAACLCVDVIIDQFLLIFDRCKQWRQEDLEFRKLRTGSLSLNCVNMFYDLELLNVSDAVHVVYSGVPPHPPPPLKAAACWWEQWELIESVVVGCTTLKCSAGPRGTAESGDNNICFVNRSHTHHVTEGHGIQI